METTPRHDWTETQIASLFDLPFMDLLYQARTVHKQSFKDNTVQLSTLLSIKTGSCPENCSYCPQSAHYKTEVEKQALLDIDSIKAAAAQAKANGATRFCMGAAWRSPPKKETAKLQQIISEVKAMGLETCVTLGMLNEEQAQAFAEAGLDYYNHNIDTSPEFYDQITTTHSFQDRIDTLEHVRKAGIKTCCGGIMGMGETRQDRIRFLQELANLPQQPESVPINRLVTVAGTPLEKTKEIDSFEFVRVIAVARIMMPNSVIRLSAGRNTMNDELHALCYFAGANSIFFGEKLLTTALPEVDRDQQLFSRLDLQPLASIDEFRCQ